MVKERKLPPRSLSKITRRKKKKEKEVSEWLSLSDLRSRVKNKNKTGNFGLSLLPLLTFLCRRSFFPGRSLWKRHKLQRSPDFFPDCYYSSSDACASRRIAQSANPILSCQFQSNNVIHRNLFFPVKYGRPF